MADLGVTKRSVAAGEALESESAVKTRRLQSLLERHQVDAVLLRQAANFAWLTGGAASYVNTAATNGAASLLITPFGRYVITDNIEATRLKREEQLEDQGWEFRTAPWFEADEAVFELTRSCHLGADHAYPGAVDLSAEFPRLRVQLTPEEGQRFRQLGRLCADAMDEAIRSLHTGMTEYEIAGALADSVERRGVLPTVNLIATDERIFRFRHPLPTGKRLERYAMLILCGRMQGLVCSLTRLVHFGRLPDDLRRKAEAVARIDAGYIAATRPGRRLSDIFEEGTQAYRRQGFADEWRLHHQGGPAGYEPREFIVTPTTDDAVSLGQAYAWNPSITGVKSEDTILVGAAGNEVLTSIPGWPTVKVDFPGSAIDRPAIMEVE